MRLVVLRDVSKRWLRSVREGLELSASAHFRNPRRKESTVSAMDPIYLDPGIIQVYFAFVVAMLVLARTMVVAGLIYAWVEQRARG